MKTFDWIQHIIAEGKLCDQYTDKVQKAVSKKALADIALDYNGASFFCEMEQAGYPIDYDVLKKEFAPFINGKYRSEHDTKSGITYTTSLWCRYNDDYEILVDTTVATLLDCELDVVIPENHYTTLFVNKSCKLRIFCMDGAMCNVYYWGDAIVENPKNNKNIKIRKRDE